jgi:hypothetical protein
MSNALSEEKRQQVIALGRLGWPLRPSGALLALSGEACEAPAEMREAAEAETVSSLSIFFPYDEGFLFYELRTPCSIPFRQT